MVQASPRQIFVNLPVADLQQSMAFFSTLGFEFNPKFTNDQGACMIVNAGAYVMLLASGFFQTFTRKRVCDTSERTEAINAFSVGSRAQVDAVYQQAIASGGQKAMDSQDHGFMYSRAFYDLDGHHWEVLWFDPAAAS
jgi:predicted lactoylglutathione lyase